MQQVFSVHGKRSPQVAESGDHAAQTSNNQGNPVVFHEDWETR
jgi:hypothetical protein